MMRKPVTVGYVIQASSYGGAHNQVVQLAGPLALRGFESVVIISDEVGNVEPRLQAAGLRVVRVPLRRVRANSLSQTFLYILTLPQQVLRLAQAFRRLDVNLVQAHGITNVDVPLAAAFAGCRVSWQLLDTRAPKLLRRALAPLVRLLADAVLVTGSRTAAAHPGLNGLGSRVVKYHPPVPLPSRPSASTRQSIRAQLGVGPGEILVGSLGNLNPQKGHEVLLQAMASHELRREGVTLRIRGAITEGHETYAEELKRSIAQENNMQVVRELEDEITPSDFVSALDVFVLSSINRSEGLPTAIIESMMAGVAVIASDVGGVTEMVSDGRTGLIVAAGDVVGLRDALRQLIDSPSLRVKVGLAGRRYAHGNLGIDKTITAYESAYEIAFSGRRRR